MELIRKDPLLMSLLRVAIGAAKYYGPALIVLYAITCDHSSRPMLLKLIEMAAVCVNHLFLPTMSLILSLSLHSHAAPLSGAGAVSKSRLIVTDGSRLCRAIQVVGSLIRLVHHEHICSALFAVKCNLCQCQLEILHPLSSIKQWTDVSRINESLPCR